MRPTLVISIPRPEVALIWPKIQPQHHSSPLARIDSMWIVRAALRNPYGVIVLALMIVVLGLVAIANIPIDILPVFKSPAVQVLTYFQGMPAASVEMTITNRMERWVNQ